MRSWTGLWLFVFCHDYLTQAQISMMSQFNTVSIPQSLWTANQTFTGVTYQVQCASMCATRGQCQYLFNPSLSTCQIGSVPIYQTGVAPFITIYYQVQESEWNAYNNWTACSVTCGYGTQTRTRTCQGTCPTPWSSFSCPGSNIDIQTCNTQVSCTSTHLPVSNNGVSLDLSLNPTVSPSHNTLANFTFSHYYYPLAIVIENGLLICGGFPSLSGANVSAIPMCYFYGFGAAAVGYFHSNMSSARGAQCANYYKNRSVWMVAGASTYSFTSDHSLATSEILDPVTKTWTPGPALPVGLLWACMVSVDQVYDQYVLVGGSAWIGGSSQCYNQTHQYSWSTGNWTTLPSTNVCHNAMACASIVLSTGDVAIVLAGGATSTTDVEIFYMSNPSSWTTGPSLPSGLGIVTWGYAFQGSLFASSLTGVYELTNGLTSWIARTDLTTTFYNGTSTAGSGYQYCPINCDLATCAVSGTSYGGTDFSSSVSSVASASACKDLCQHMAGCPFYSYSSSNSTCYFKTTNTITSSNAAFTSGPATCGCLQVGQAYDITAYIDVFTGITDAELCQWYCIQDTNCEFMVYYTKGYANSAQWMHCYKLGWPALTAPNATGVISGVKICP